MKRIIEGATYNTDTATLVASGRADNDPQVVETNLYQNRSGLYFCVDTITVAYRDRHGEIKERIDHEWNVVGDAAKARAFCEEYALTIDRDIEDMPPEAALGEKLATLYVRLPPTLKDSITAQAEAKNVSANVYALRCLEECETRGRGPNAFWNAVAGLEQFQSDPATVWNPAEDAKEWREYGQGWREFRLKTLESLIGKLKKCRDAYLV